MARTRRYFQSWSDAVLFPELHRLTAAQRIAHRLRKQILTDALHHGAKLPGQREMAQHLDVGVATLREAIAILVAEGLLTTRQGRGTFVTERRPRRMTEIAMRSATAAELDEARRFIETGAASRAAQRSADEGNGPMRPVPMSELAWSLRWRHDGRADAWLRLDAEFHEELCRLGGTGHAATAQVGSEILDRLRRRRSARVHRLVADTGLHDLHMDLALAVDRGRADAAAALARRIVRREAAAVR